MMDQSVKEISEINNRSLYGASGGNEHRGILTDIKVSDLPFESKEDFSSDPLSFEKSALIIWEDTQKIYDHACTENRFSENYLKYCAQLERNIKHAGSLCLTKTVLEQNGFEFPQLENMTIRELAGMVSFHLLKCHAALDGIYKDNNFLGLTYLNWEIRWFDLENRLKATEVKIQKIREGKINTEKMLQQEQVFKDELPAEKNHRCGSPKSLRINANALPLDGSMARYMLGIEAEKAKVLRAQQRENDRWRRAAEAAGILSKPYKPMSRKEILMEMKKDLEAREKQDEAVIQTETAGEAQYQKPAPPGMMPVAEARQILIDKALKENDPETADMIEKEDRDSFRKRWQIFLEQSEMENRRKAAASGRAGPSAEKRKALREKRKRRK